MEFLFKSLEYFLFVKALRIFLRSFYTFLKGIVLHVFWKSSKLEIVWTGCDSPTCPFPLQAVQVEEEVPWCVWDSGDCSPPNAQVTNYAPVLTITQWHQCDWIFWVTSWMWVKEPWLKSQAKFSDLFRLPWR